MKYRTTTILTMTLAALLACSCNQVREKVVQSYPTGEPMLVVLEKGKKDNPTRIGEKMYYQNGQLQLEKQFSGKPEIPDGIWNYYWDNGQLFATGDFTQNHQYGSNWVFYNRNGGPYYDGKLDSVSVSGMGLYGTPSTVSFYSGNNQDVIQFYSNYTVRSTERLSKNMREGKVYFYFPNGNIQVEANFVNGQEEGTYIVYHENGVPYYQGKYAQGKRVGIWEFYDQEGNLVEQKDYSN
jgi:antitoxin component YwqK of YwqJK toxin-antitoxin module